MKNGIGVGPIPSFAQILAPITMEMLNFLPGEFYGIWNLGIDTIIFDFAKSREATLGP